MTDSGKIITIVTGGSRGIGAATARLCGANGHDVAVVYRSESEAAAAVVADIEAVGARAIAVRADTANERDVVDLFEHVTSALGPVTGLVNNAGIFGPRGRVENLTSRDVMDVLSINVAGLFYCAREAIRRMSTKNGGAGGCIVNISSGSAKIGNPGSGVLYAASKGAVDSLTIGLSQEVIGEGIRVNGVSPGLTDTDMPGSARLAQEGPKIPLGRVARAEEIAEAVLWLMSAKASYVAGASIRVGGGRP